jgi:RimJ/RimL family protein N-acetyltransferase
MNAVASPATSVATLPVTTPSPWLTTKRLRLREFSLADRYALVRMHKNPRVRALLVDDEPLDRHAVVHELIVRLQVLYRQHEGLGIWCAEHMVTALDAADLERPEMREKVAEMLSPSALESLLQPRPRFAGWFNLMPMSGQPEEVELGSRLLPEVWGIGLALEGGERLLSHAFDTLGRERVWAVGHIENHSVRYCVTALGFEDRGVRDYEGKSAQYYVIDEPHWRQWRNLSRKHRQRRAVIACREITNSADNRHTTPFSGVGTAHLSNAENHTVVGDTASDTFHCSTDFKRDR